MSGPGTGRRRINVGRTVLIGVVASTIPLIGNVVASFVADWSGGVAWLAVPVTAVVFGVIGALATAHIEERVPDSAPSAPTGMPVRRRRGMTLTAGLLVAVLVLAGGGLAVALGARYVVGWITGNEEGVERLVSARSVTDRGVTLTVSGIAQTSHFTRVAVTASNDRPNSITVPLFSNGTLRGVDGTTLQADPFRSDWSETLALGTHGQRGTIVFQGTCPTPWRPHRWRSPLLSRPGSVVPGA